MADLVTKLILNNDDFNRNLKMSAQEIKQFRDIGNKVTGTLGKFAGAIGAATSAHEIFERTVRGSQTTSDNFDLIMRACTTTVDSFFSALSTGDFSTFNQGLDVLIQKAMDANSALDQLGNTIISFDYFSGKNNAAFNEKLNIARDNSKSKAERDKALQEAKKIYSDQQSNTKSLYDTSLAAVKAVVAEGSGFLRASDISWEDVERIIHVDLERRRDAKKKAYTQQYNDLLKIQELSIKKHTTYTFEDRGNTSRAVAHVDRAAVRKDMEKYNAKFKDAMLFNEILVKQSDDWLKNLTGMMGKSNSAEYALSSMQRKMLRITNQGAKGGSHGGKGGTSKNVLTDKQMIDLQKVFDNTTTVKIKFDFEKSIDELQTELSFLEKKFKKEPPEIAVTLIPRMNELKEAINKIEKGDIPTGKPRIREFKAVKENPINSDMTAQNEDYIDSLNGIATLLNNISQLTNDSAAAWINWAATLMSSIAAAIPAIEALSAAKKEEAVANGVASATQTPIVGWLLAGAAVAAVAAALFAMPKFATGGIVGGNSSVGDMNLVRVNSGEMILNGSQQRRLFDLLNGGGAMGNANNEVEFKIKGSQLVGVMNNYNKKRIRI